MTRAARALAPWLVLAALAGGCRPAVPFAERTFFSGGRQTLPAAEDCERCHQEVVLEWRGSAHASAWTSKAFRAATHDARVDACTGCHAPAPLAAGRPPALRAERRDEGVTCTTCHLSSDPQAAPLTMRGPASRSLPVEVHPVIAEDPLYRSSELCGGCHQATFAEWQAAADARAEAPETCQGCHMPSVHRTVESVNEAVPYSPLLVALESEQELRRHLFAVPDDAGEDVILSLERTATALAVHVDNRLPHALPTGSFGRRELRLFATWPGGESVHAFAARPGGALAAGAGRAVEIPLLPAARAARVTVSLRRFDPASREWREIARAESPPAS